MSDPVIRASAQAAGMAWQSARQPLVMVRLGRREDRAAAYDRFIEACARCARARDGSLVDDVWATWQAINLRAHPKVRHAAQHLAMNVFAIADPNGAGRWYAKRMDRLLRTEGAWLYETIMLSEGEDYDDEFVRLVSHFVAAAREDLAPWYLKPCYSQHKPWYWRWLLPPVVKRRLLSKVYLPAPEATPPPNT